MDHARGTPASRVELGGHTQLYRAYPFETALERLAQAGFQVIGVANRHAGRPLITAGTPRDEIEALGRRIAAHGLTPRLTGSFPAAGDAPEAVLRRSVEVAALLGCPFVTSHGPSPYAGRLFGPRKREMQYYQEVTAYFAALRAVAPLAARLGVTIVLKPHSGVTGTGADLADIVGLLDLPSVGICYDAGNILFFEGRAPEEDVTACAAYVRAVAIKDHRGGRGSEGVPAPGEGVVDHARLFRALLAAGFAGPAIIERIDGCETAEAMDAALARARAHLEQALAAAAAPGDLPRPGDHPAA